VQTLGETGTVLSVDSDGDVRVDVTGHVWTFNPACCTGLPATARKRADKQSPHSDDSDNDDDDDDDDEQHVIGTSVSQFCNSLRAS